MSKRHVAVVSAFVLAPALALAIPSDASVQNQVTASGSFSSVRVDSPSEDNDGNGPDGRVFCTLYDEGRCMPINKASCNNGDERAIQFLITPSDEGVAENSRMYVFATTGSCSFSENQEPDDVPVPSVDLGTSSDLVVGRATTWPDDLGGFPDYDTVGHLMESIHACDDSGIQNQRWNLCIGISEADSDSSTAPNELTSDAPLVKAVFLVDTIVPDAPSTFEVTGGDAQFNVRVAQSSNSSEISKYIIRYRQAANDSTEVPEGDDCNTWSDYKERSITRQGESDDATSFTVDDIENNINFEICAAALDLAGNLGTFSDPLRARTHDECDFIECYPGDPPTGYCGSVPPSMIALWASVAMLARRRFRRKALVILPVLFVIASPSIAHAVLEPPRDIWTSDFDEKGSDKRPVFGVELRLGPTRPKIGNADAQRVYNKVFDGKSTFAHKPLLVQLEVDWYFINRFGLLGLFGRVGYWRATGHTRNCATDEDPTATCDSTTIDDSIQGASKTSLTVLPLTLGVVYKFDRIKETTWIPLVPYAKAGVDYYFWTNTAGGKTSTARDGSKGRGGQVGINGSLGLAMNLDWIDYEGSMNARSGAGIADIYLFFEWTGVYGNIRSQSLDFSASYFLAGLSFDMF